MKFEACADCPSPAKCAKQGCQKGKTKMSYGGMAKKPMKMMGGGMAKKSMGYNKGGMAKAGASNPPNRKAKK